MIEFPTTPHDPPPQQTPRLIGYAPPCFLCNNPGFLRNARPAQPSDDYQPCSSAKQPGPQITTATFYYCSSLFSKQLCN